MRKLHNKSSVNIFVAILISSLLIQTSVISGLDPVRFGYASEEGSEISVSDKQENPVIEEIGEEFIITEEFTDPVIEEIITPEEVSDEVIDAPEILSSPIIQESEPTSPQLTTDKADYFPGETAIVYGSFFSSLQQVLITIIGVSDDESTLVTDSWGVTVDNAGEFTTQYTLPYMYVPLYFLAANSTTGELLAETSFTDNKNLTVTKAGTGSGGVTSNTGSAGESINCNSACSSQTKAFGNNDSITLTASPDSGATVTWSVIGGATSISCPSGNACSFNMNNKLIVVTITLTSTIKTDPTLSVTNSPAAYNGSAQAATITGSVAGVVSNVKYNGSLTIPTDPNTYAITANFVPTNTTNYNSLVDASAGNFLINKAPSTTLITCPESVTYTGSELIPCTTSVTGAGGLSLTPNPIYADNTNAGTALASYTYGGDANHDGSSDSEEFDIDKADVDITLTCPESVTYSGLAQEPCTASVTGAGGLDESLSIDYEDNIDAGTALAETSFEGDANHEDSSEDTEFEIDKADADITVTGYSVIHDGSSHTSEGTATGVQDEDLSELLDLSETTHTEIGVYLTDAWSFSGNDNYNSAEGTVENEIAKQAPIISGESSLNVNQDSILGAIITWTTNQAATSRVVYDIISRTLGSAPNYGYAFSTDETDTDPMVIDHSVTLSGLSFGTSYFYRVVSHGSPETISEERSFVTESESNEDNNGGSSGNGSGSSGGGSSFLVAAINNEPTNTETETTVPPVSQPLGTLTTGGSAIQETTGEQVESSTEPATEIQPEKEPIENAPSFLANILSTIGSFNQIWGWILFFILLILGGWFYWQRRSRKNKNK